MKPSVLVEEAYIEGNTIIAASLINANNEVGDNADYVRENNNCWEIEW